MIGNKTCIKKGLNLINYFYINLRDFDFCSIFSKTKYVKIIFFNIFFSFLVLFGFKKSIIECVILPSIFGYLPFHSAFWVQTEHN